MKKTIAFIVLLVTISLNLCALFNTSRCINNPNEKNAFPRALLSIEEEAFSGTALKTVVLPNGFLSIGEQAFENMVSLTDMYIPSTTQNISEMAFSEDSDSLIHGVEDSFVSEWAKTHNVPFVDEEKLRMILANDYLARAHRASMVSKCQVVIIQKNTQKFNKTNEQNVSKRPQDRSELNPIDYRFP